MAQKYELICALYEQTLKEISASQSAWQEFLRSVCNNYKCRFDEQVLIYAQRPDATAVLEIERWNKQFGRWVNGGATGIAVFDRQADNNPRLKHYFDISDTHENARFAKPVPVWRMKPQYHDEVIETLEASFGTLKNKSTLVYAIFSAVENAVEDNHQAYLAQLLGVTDESALDGMDADAIGLFFKEALAGSICTMLLTRCDEKTSEFLPPMRLSAMRNFNTLQTTIALGTATSDIAETMLREIARTVLAIQVHEKNEIRTLAKEKQTEYALPISQQTQQSERSFEHGNHIQNARRLSPAQPAAAASGGSGHREIRTDAQAVSGTASQNQLFNPVDERDAARAFSGNQQDSQGEPQPTDARDDAGAGRDGGIESERPNALGGTGQQYQERSGGNRAEGNRVQLTEQPQETPQAQQPAQTEETKIINTDTKPLRTPQEQVSFFDADFHVDTDETSLQISMFRGFEISQQIIDEVLCLGSDDPKSKKRICAYYMKDKPLVDNIRFLKQEYKIGGEGFMRDGHKVSVWFDEAGIRIAEGEHTNTMSATLLTWEAVAKRINELLTLGRYMPQAEIDAAPALERNEIANMLLYTWRDIDESAAALNLLSTIGTAYRNTKGFPDSQAEVAALLEQPEAVATIIEEYKAFSAAYENDPEILRFRFYKPQPERLQRLLDLQREPRSFTAAEQIAPPIERFITRDELDEALRGGSNNHDSRLALYSFFLHNRDPKVRAKYLKSQQIYSGYTWGPNGYVTKESKGFSMSRGDISTPYSKLVLSWSKVQHRTAQLIAQGKFLSEADYAAMPQYEKHEIAREVYFAFDNVPQETPHPYPYGFDYYAAVPLIEKQLDDTIKTAELEQLLLPVLESTATDDRYYEIRKKAVEMVSAYRDGTFSLFGRRGEKPDLSLPVQTLTPAEEKAETAKELAARLHDIYDELGAPTDTAPTLDDLVRDLQQPQKRKGILHTLPGYLKGIDPEEETADAIQSLLEDLKEFGKAPQQNSAEIMALFADEPVQEEPSVQPVQGITQAVQAQLGKVTKAKGYAAFAADVKKLLHDKNGDGLVPIAALAWLKKIAALSDTELKEYADSYEAGTLDTLPILKESAAASLKADTPAPIPPPRKINTRILFEPLHPEVPKEQRHDFCITDPQLGVGTASEKYAANLAAIHTLQAIEAENRLATPDEQAVLSRYVGWGGLANCFEETHHKYGELKSILTETEYAAARESTLTAFYTPPVVIEGIYKALAQMGFEQGNVLDPACGVGNFLGMLPEAMRSAKLYGVELDSISGRIAQQLYQNGNIAVSGFEKVEMPDSFFDVAVGNVPFGDFKVLDRRYDKHKFLIHDYFFGKTLDKVRPGGVVAFVTSKGTMDKKNGAVRKYLAQRADLIGAIRLPNDTFKKNAGTEVTSDIIFLQKRDRMVDIEPDKVNFPAGKREGALGHWVHLETDENGITMNSYFVQHPEMVLGEMVMQSGPFGMESTCKAYENADLARLMDEALQNIHAEVTDPELEDLGDTDEDLSIPADPSVRNFSYTVSDGKLYFRDNSRMYPISTTETGENRIRGMITLRDCARRLIELQTEDYPEADICDAQAELNRLYDAYTKKYDVLSGRGNEMAFGEDSSYPLLCSLEMFDDNRKFIGKAAMFTKRTIKPHVPVTSVDTSSEALAVSISEKAHVDMEYMAQLSGKSEEEIERDLTGVIFRNVKCATEASDIPKAFVQKEQFSLVNSDEYLSGNVREKLAMARALYEALPTEEKEWLAPNVSALEAVQPVDLTAGEISVRIGATWIPPKIYEQFMFELFGTGANGKNKINILYTKCTGEWHVTNKSADHGNVKVFNNYGTLRAPAYYILEKTLNLKDVRIFDTKLVNGNETRIFNKEETQIAQDKQDIIKAAFKDWLWKDIDRREAMCKLYNETFNSIRPREYDGKHIKFPGMNPEYTMLPHQINAIARALYCGNTLLAHCVGAGKTFEMVAIAMETRRLGLCTKSLFTVPNHIIGQFAAEWLQLYPSANLLVATKKDFEAKNRKKFCARISTGEYDAVIIGHSQSEKIPMSPERQEVILQQQLDEMSYGIDEARRAECPRYTVKQMEKSRKALETRLALLNDQHRKDNVVCFEELGADRLFVDESHYFKNLFLVSKMRNVGGIAQCEAQKSSDLFMKCRYLDELTDGKGIIFATGTPISNSIVEMFTIQRYLQYDRLQELDLLQFDSWASTFGETVTEMELAPEGSGLRMKTRFANFYNLPELISIFKEVADIQTADMLKLPVPKANFHTEVIQPSEMQKEMVAACATRAEKVRNGSVDPRIDNMLKITNDGRKIALDIRLFNPLAPDDENGKVSTCARNVFRIWQNTTEKRGAQLAFCDMSTPTSPRPIEMQETKDGSFEMIPDQFINVYDDLKRKLIAQGIPEHEIAFIHEANTETKKMALFGKVRSGEVRVLMGSTAKMGAGTNVQKKLVALHDLDCPWRPSEDGHTQW